MRPGVTCPAGIDLIAGPSDSLVIADATADPEIIAWDLVGQVKGHARSAEIRLEKFG